MCTKPTKRRTAPNVIELDRSQSVASETAVIVSVVLPEYEYLSDPLDELEGLAETAGTKVVGRMTQRREKPDPGTYLGRGKLEELTHFVEKLKADVVLFDNDLSPGQVRNLEKTLNVKVIDRTELILDIFATHAKTHEARLAVELAQLEYSLPRLKRMWTHLSRIKHGVGMRGPGEKQLEEDRRIVERRIRYLKQNLEKIERRKEREVAARRDARTISLVGYTNAGKSTLMNALTEANVKAEDALFATLDTRTRRWQLPNWGPVLLSDTVGFIRDLPHRLIASFKATLEEARQADLLLHVEALADSAQVDSILRRYPNAVPVSAKSGEGLDRLAMAVSEELSRSFREVDVEMDVGNGRLMAYLARHGEVLSKRFRDERVTIHCRLPGEFLGKIDDADVVISEHSINRDSEEPPMHEVA